MTYWLLGAAIMALLAILVSCSRAGPAESAPKAPPASNARIDESAPFMEHPSDKDETAVDAMTDAVTRLRQLERWDRWITFSAQGQGGLVDSYQPAELKLLGDKFDVGNAFLDADKALRSAALDKSGIEVSRSPEGYIVLGRFSPRQVAMLMDALFRGQMGIRPHDGEGYGYAVGAEW